MSKRRLGNEIDELNNKILGDLKPDQRLQHLLSAQADGNERWTKRIIDTCPRHRYRATDYAFIGRLQLAKLMAFRAIYELHTTYLQYVFTRQQQRYTWLIDFERDEKPSDEELDRASKRVDELRELFAELYTNYHAQRRFATEVLDVDLETWLALHAEGTAVFEVVGDMIDDQREIERAESWLSERLEDEETMDDQTAEPDGTASDGDHQVALEGMTERRYKVLVMVWEDIIAEFPD